MQIIRSAFKLQIGKDIEDSDDIVIRAFDADGEAVGEAHTFHLKSDHASIIQELEEKQPHLTPDELAYLGQAMYRAVFTQEIAEAFGQARGNIDRDEGIRLQLQINDPECHMYPWEVLHNGRGLLATEMPVVRSLPQQDNVPERPEQVRGKLRVLFVAASPKGGQFDALKIEQLADNLKTQIDKVVQEYPRMTRWQRRGVELDIHQRISPVELSELIEKKSYQVLCFAGHGGVDDKDNPAIMLEDHGDIPKDKPGWAEPLTASELGNTLNGSGIQLVFLAACETAKRVPDDNQTNETVAAPATLNDFATSLAQSSGIPAVIAMRTYVGMESANRITADFFANLARFQPVDQALANARQRYVLADKINRDSLAPVLYLQTQHSNLFRAAPNFLLYALIAITLLFTVVVPVQYVRNRRAIRLEREIAQQNLLEEQYVRIQTLSQVNQAERVRPAGRNDTFNVRPPVFAGGQFWLLEATQQQVEPLDASGRPMHAPIPLSAVPDRMWVFNDSVWITAGSESVVWRIDPGSYEVTTIEVRGAPDQLVQQGDFVFAQSITGASITRIDVETNATQTHRVGLNTSPATPFNGSLWYTQRDDIVRLDPDELTEQRTAGERGLQLGVIASSLYGLAGENLYTIDASTGELSGQLSLGRRVQFPIFAEGNLWGVSIDSAEVFRIDANADVTWFDLPAMPSGIYATPGRLWVPLENDTVALLNAHTGETMATVDLPGAALVDRQSPVVYDGSHTWITVPNLDTVTVIDDTGNIFRQFSPCEQPTAPLYDGSLMWFACAEELISIPARMTQLPTGRLTESTENHAAVVQPAEDVVWLVQETDQRVLLLDAETFDVLDEFDVQGTLQPLYADLPYVWTASPGEIHRLQVDTTTETPSIAARTVNITGAVNQIMRADDHIWFLQADLENLANAPDVSTIHRETLTLRERDFGLVSSSLSYIEDDVWLTASDDEEGYILRFDPETLETNTHLDIPETDFTSWAPVAVDGNLWFTAGAPPLGKSIGTFLGDLVGEQSDLGKTIFEFDPDAMAWTGTAYETPTFPLAPTVHDGTLWYSLTNLAIIGDMSNPDDVRSGIWGIDVTGGGQTYGPFSICDGSIADMAIAGDYLYMGCVSSNARVAIMDLTQRCVVHAYEQVGTNPNALLEHDGRVWITYEDTDTLAVFDRETGRLLQIIDTGDQPMTPFVLDGFVWIYGAQDGVLQRVTPDQMLVQEPLITIGQAQCQ